MRKILLLTVMCALGLFGSLKAQKTTFSYDFNDGSLAGWRVFQATETEGEPVADDSWMITPKNDIYLCGSSESQCVYSNSYPYGPCYCYNYIVTEAAYKITESSTLSWFVRHSDYGYEHNDPYQVVISESGADDSFTQIWDGTYVIRENNKEISLAEYAGKVLYIGFYHYGYGGASLCIDDIVLSSDEVGEDPVEPEPTAPIAPVITAEAVADSVYVKWDAVENAEYYTLYYIDQALGSFTNTYATIGVPSVGDYCFTVTASNEYGESEHSNEACATVECPEGLEIPAAPVLTAKVENDSIVLSWDPVETALYYIVYFEGEVSGLLSETEVKLFPSIPETYCFTVTAVNLAGESVHSNEVCVTYPEDGIEENVASFNIYPNPVNDKLYIETEVQVEEIAVYDIYGRLACRDASNASTNASNASTNAFNVSVQDLDAGIYFVKIVTENGEVVKRFIKK